MQKPPYTSIRVKETYTKIIIYKCPIFKKNMTLSCSKNKFVK